MKSNSTPKRTALITGASAGIGKDFAELLAKKGFNLVLVARRADRLKALAQKLENNFSIKVKVLIYDLAKKESPKKIFNDLNATGITIDFLVNNAGYSLKTPFIKDEWQNIEGLLNVMAHSVTELCHLFLPKMREQNYGRIINVSSIAAYAPESYGSLYTPIKRYVVSLSKALSLEALSSDIKVTALCPGFTYTEFHDVLGNREKMNKLPKFMWMDSKSVVEAGYNAVINGNKVCVPGLVNKIIVGLCYLTPTTLLDVLRLKKLKI